MSKKNLIRLTIFLISFVTVFIGIRFSKGEECVYDVEYGIYNSQVNCYQRKNYEPKKNEFKRNGFFIESDFNGDPDFNIDYQFDGDPDFLIEYGQ